MCFGVKDIVGMISYQLRRQEASQIYCYPDEGAMKKYSEQIDGEYVFGIKHRDWRTGKIESLQLNNTDAVNGKDVLIIDDICSRGGTFILTAQALKDAGAANVILYVTHCENTILEGEIPNSDLISRVFTTGSIYRGNHEKITVMDFPKSAKG
jgi:ribose-phosphate pyrophosphokinase